MGATITVRKCWFISSGETTRQGRVFLISDPRVGSRDISQTSSRRGRRLTTSIPCDRTRWLASPPTAVHRCRLVPLFQIPRPILGATGDPERSPGDHSRPSVPRFLPDRIARSGVSECEFLSNCQYERDPSSWL